MLEPLRFSLYRFHLSARLPATLSSQEHPGVRLRDRFGSALKASMCPQPNRACRDGCIDPGSCLYTRLFETSRQAFGTLALDGQDLPRPFVLEPPLEMKRQYASGETMVFHLVLVGQAQQHIPHFIAAFEEMGRHGFGMEQAPWVVQRVDSLSNRSDLQGTVIYEGAQQRLVGRPIEIGIAELLAESEALSKERITVQFTTPLRIEERGKALRELNVDVFLRALLRRLSRLALVWCSPIEINYREILDQWRGSVQCADQTWRWEEWQRHPGRSGSELKLGGIRGQITLEGDLNSLRQFLTLGEYLHLGKQTAFGLGLYSCRKHR